MFFQILINPLYEFFRKAPTFFGGYGGLPEEDICTKITNAPSYLWTQNKEECTKLIERRYESFYVCFYVFLYIFSIYKLFNYLWLKYFVIKPILSEIKNVLQNKKFVAIEDEHKTD